MPLLIALAGRDRQSGKALSFEVKTIDEVVEDIERRMVEDALKKYHWNKQKAAQELGLSRQGLGKMLKRLGIKG